MSNKVKLDSTAYEQKRSVKELTAEEQPREKLQKHGPDSLSDAELLAILLRTGSTKMNVIETSRTLLEHFGGLRPMARKSWQELRVINGVATVKAITLEAVFEIARRLQVAGLEEKIKMKSPDDVAAFFGPKLRDLRKETFIVTFLNAAKIMLGYKKISIGGVTATIVDPAEVMRQAIMNDAHSIVVLHNHPSGNARASQSDIQLTKRLSEVGKLLGVALEDHIIIAGYDHISLREKGLV
ncbi:MAG: DNA repair protein RadC [Balneolales bacterium]